MASLQKELDAFAARYDSSTSGPTKWQSYGELVKGTYSRLVADLNERQRLTAEATVAKEVAKSQQVTTTRCHCVPICPSKLSTSIENCMKHVRQYSQPPLGIMCSMVLRSLRVLPVVPENSAACSNLLPVEYNRESIGESNEELIGESCTLSFPLVIDIVIPLLYSR